MSKTRNNLSAEQKAPSLFHVKLLGVNKQGMHVKHGRVRAGSGCLISSFTAENNLIPKDLGPLKRA